MSKTLSSFLVHLELCKGLKIMQKKLNVKELGAKVATISCLLSIYRDQVELSYQITGLDQLKVLKL